MKVVKFTIKNTRFMLCLQKRSYTNHNWFSKTKIGGEIANLTHSYSFGFRFIGRINLYITNY